MKQTSYVASVITRPHCCRLLPVGAIWTASSTPSNVTLGKSCGMPPKWLGRQYARSLTAFSGQGIPGATGFSYAQTNDGPFQHLSKPLVTGEMPFCSGLIHTLSTTTISSFFSCFLLPYLAKEAVATSYRVRQKTLRTYTNKTSSFLVLMLVNWHSWRASSTAAHVECWSSICTCIPTR
jgi:hypothetical protein